VNKHTSKQDSHRTPPTGPVGRTLRLLLAIGFAYGLATVVDQGGPASVRDAEALTDLPYVVLTIAMVAVYTVLVSELAKIVGGEAVAKAARTVALAVLAAAAAAAAVVGELRAGAVWGSPLSDLVWALDVAMLVQTIVALLLAVMIGTRGCEIGVWADIAARLRGGPASSPLCIVGLHHIDAWELRRRSDRGRAAHTDAAIRTAFADAPVPAPQSTRSPAAPGGLRTGLEAKSRTSREANEARID
jgi:hypothetical protein